jgi:adenine-specific DNA glycosylase
LTTTGAYTAGAVASIAFKQKVPVVDGNVIRFLSRMRSVKLEAKDKRLSKACWKGAAQLVQGTTRPGDLNQSMMELGATCCTPKKPTCTLCPVRDNCGAFGANPLAVTEYPLPATKKFVPEFNIGVLVVVRAGKLRSGGGCGVKAEEEESGVCEEGMTKALVEEDQYLLWKRPSTGLLAGQWEFACSALNDDDVLCGGDTIKTKRKSKGAMKQAIKVNPSVLQKVILEEVKQRTFHVDCDDAHDRSIQDGCSSCRLLATAEESPTPVYVDTFTHVFSHVKHKMLVHTCQLPCACQSPAAFGVHGRGTASDIQWMTVQQMKEVGVTKQVTQVLGLVERFHRTPRLPFQATSAAPERERCVETDPRVNLENDQVPSRKEKVMHDLDISSVDARVTRARRPRACKEPKTSKKVKLNK